VETGKWLIGGWEDVVLLSSMFCIGCLCLDIHDVQVSCLASFFVRFLHIFVCLAFLGGSISHSSCAFFGVVCVFGWSFVGRRGEGYDDSAIWSGRLVPLLRVQLLVLSIGAVFSPLLPSRLIFTLSGPPRPHPVCIAAGGGAVSLGYSSHILRMDIGRRAAE